MLSLLRLRARRLRIRAAEYGRSAEAEHREILRLALVVDDARQVGRQQVAQRLADLRKRTAGRGSSPAAALPQEARCRRNVIHEALDTITDQNGSEFAK